LAGYLRSTKISWQSAGPTFSAECDAMMGTAMAVPALLVAILIFPSAPYSFVLQPLTE
jgi:hypothetical protein